jgi:Proto-chlorophyllide reductase 57 kD subunit
MKFLCVACDEPMRLEKTEKPRESTITALFECPECFTQIAMLTNPSETQMIQSLGVKIGPGAADGLGADGLAADGLAAEGIGAAGQAAAGAGAAKCPFAGILGSMEAATTPDGVQWTAEALSRLDNIPDFIRPMAKQGIEHFAESNGCPVIDEAVLEQARGKFGM